MKTIFVALQQLNLYITPVPLSQNYKTDKIEHNAGEVLFRGQTASQDVAAAVEAEARRRGFYIGKVGHGGNGTNSYSIYVYLRDLYTIE